jgi:hypothetical protein
MSRLSSFLRTIAVGGAMDLIERFEQCTLPIAEMHHTQHLEIALWYVLHYPPEEALERMRNGLKALLAQNGVGSSYNEEVTLGWMTFVQKFVAQVDRTVPFSELAHQLALSAEGHRNKLVPPV